MQHRQSVAGGTIVGAIGVATALYSVLNYEIGRLSNIGPAAFPLGLGVLLAVFGAGLMLQGRREATSAMAVELRNVGFVLLGICCFALLVPRVGLFPSAVIGGAVAARADGSSNLAFCAILGLCLAAFSTALFHYLLGLPIPAFSWNL